MDLNNQMILMRKEIKRAKVHVICKLIRRNKALRNKKGTETQKLNNSNRADRLLEEIDILKDVKPDTIFKQLMSMKVSINDLSNLSLRDRVITRIGLLNFIEDKMAKIRLQIKSFDNERTKKNIVSSLQVIEKLPNNKVNANQKINENPKPNNSTNKENAKLINSSVSSKTLTLNNSDSKTNGSTTKKLEYNSEDDDKMNHESVQIDEISKDFEVVLPDYLSKPDKTVHSQTKNLKSHNSIGLPQNSTTDDISNILKNYGEGYNSDSNLSVNSLSEKEDHNAELDLFFCDSDDAKKLKLTSNKHFPLKEFPKTKKFETTFVCSLGGEKNTKKNLQPKEKKCDKMKKRKKNRLGQRARKNLYSSSQESDARNIKNKSFNKKFKPKNEETNLKNKNLDLKPESDVNLHPSWQASQQLKKKSGIQEFQGKHITFDD